MYLRRMSALCAAVSLIAAPMYGQTATFDPQTGVPIFQLKARTVVVDVVVTDKADQPIQALHKQDFQVLEGGQPQTISFFEEHTGVPPETAPPPPRPSNVFTNVASAKVTDSVNVLLLDSLNTPLQDQAYVHTQTMKYLKNVEPGTRIAIFTLGNELRFVQGFTADAGMLSAALNGKGANPQQSALLRTQAAREGEAGQSDQIKQAYAQSNHAGYGSDPGIARSLLALQQFQTETQSFETDIRIKQTLLAMQQLARYLAGVPGRKNVIWFSGSFPLGIFPQPPQGTASGLPTGNAALPVGIQGGDPQRFSTVRDYGDEVKRTDDLLAAAQVAIYPIAAEGTATDGFNSAENRMGGVSTPQGARLEQTNALRDDADSRNAGHLTMDLIAHDTGGEAFYNTNNLKDAVARVMRNGSRYYTIAYTPTNKEMNGAYRPIKITLATGGGYRLAYRRGYFAADARREEAEKKNLIADPLHPYMGHGMPDSSQIAYNMSLVPSPDQPGSDAKRAGDNANLKGPVTRYTATLWLPVPSLHMEVAPDGLHKDSVEAAFVVYDFQGKALNWMVRTVELSLKPERYAAARQVGIPLRMEIDAPAGENYLRSGIYEQATQLAGTLEVPLSAVVPAVVAAK